MLNNCSVDIKETEQSLLTVYFLEYIQNYPQKLYLKCINVVLKVIPSTSGETYA